MNLSEKKNYYEVLEVPINATLQEIHNAYLQAKNAYSDDSAALYSLMTQEECNRILEQIEEAYSILGVAEKRREYDIARGFNQAHTPEGFDQEMAKRPDYKPSQSLSDYMNDSNDYSDIIQENARKEEFKYN